MKTVVSYDPSWKATAIGRIPGWDSLNTVEQVCSFLSNTDCDFMLFPADEELELKIKKLQNRNDILLFWLNEFMPTGISKYRFTVELAENYHIPHTGANSEALHVGLDKVLTKNIFRDLGILTPCSYTCFPGNISAVSENLSEHGSVIVKPLLQGGSRGIFQDSVVPANDESEISRLVRRIWYEFEEPALVESYIGGDNPREFSVPILISPTACHYYKLPIVEMNLSIIQMTDYKILSQEIKEGNIPEQEMNYFGLLLSIPASLETAKRDYLYTRIASVSKILKCQDVVRADVREEDGRFYFLEVNVTPDRSRLTTIYTSFSNLGYSQSQLYLLAPFQAMVRYGMTPPKKLTEHIQPVIDYMKESSHAKILPHTVFRRDVHHNLMN